MHSITETSFLMHTENLTFHESKHFLQHWTVVTLAIKQRGYDTWHENLSAWLPNPTSESSSIFLLSNDPRRIVHLRWQGWKLLRAFFLSPKRGDLLASVMPFDTCRSRLFLINLIISVESEFFQIHTFVQQIITQIKRVRDQNRLFAA